MTDRDNDSTSLMHGFSGVIKGPPKLSEAVNQSEQKETTSTSKPYNAGGDEK